MINNDISISLNFRTLKQFLKNHKTGWHNQPLLNILDVGTLNTHIKLHFSSWLFETQYETLYVGFFLNQEALWYTNTVSFCKMSDNIYLNGNSASINKTEVLLQL